MGDGNAAILHEYDAFAKAMTERGHVTFGMSFLTAMTP
jgi:hypothetical protein